MLRPSTVGALSVHGGSSLAMAATYSFASHLKTKIQQLFPKKIDTFPGLTWDLPPLAVGTLLSD